MRERVLRDLNAHTVAPNFSLYFRFYSLHLDAVLRYAMACVLIFHSAGVIYDQVVDIGCLRDADARVLRHDGWRSGYRQRGQQQWQQLERKHIQRQHRQFIHAI